MLERRATTAVDDPAHRPEPYTGHEQRQYPGHHELPAAQPQGERRLQCQSVPASEAPR